MNYKHEVKNKNCNDAVDLQLHDWKFFIKLDNKRSSITACERLSFKSMNSQGIRQRQ